MGIFSKKKEIDLNNVIDNPTSPEERRINMLMHLASIWTQTQTGVSLEIMRGIESHPLLWRTKGWCYAALEDLDKSLECFEAGFAAGDIRCGVYAHRLLREHTNDRERFEAMEIALEPYFRNRDNELLLAQAHLSLVKEDYVAAFTNYTTFVSGETNYSPGGIGSVFRAYQSLIEYKFNEITSDIYKVSDEQKEAWFTSLDYFFSDEIKTAEGEGLGWHNFIFIALMTSSIEREIKAGHFGSAHVLPELIAIYQEMIDLVDPPKRPETFSVDEITNALLIAIDKGNIFALINDAPIFFEENQISLKVLKKYQDELEEWGINRYLEG